MLLYHQYRSFHLAVDSRRVTEPERTLFFALPGARTDGHQYIEELYQRGVRHFVVVPERARSQVRREVLRSEEIHLVAVPDPLVLLQELAAFHRRQFDIPVVAVTGSNGKTIVKDWLVELLRDKYNVCASPRSYNSQIGVPLSVWQLNEEHDVAVFEAGVSKRGEMQRLAEIIRPACGAFTMLGAAHAAGFSSPQQKLEQKLSLFSGADWVVVPADDNAAKSVLRKMDVEIIPQLSHGRRLVEVAEVPLTFDFPDWPRIYLDNAATALAVAYTLGVTHEELSAAFPRLQPLGNRLEQREGLHGGPVINDSYSNDLTALAAALDFAAAQNPDRKLTLILGTLQAGYDAEELRALLEDKVDRLITVTRLHGNIRVGNLEGSERLHGNSRAANLGGPKWLHGNIRVSAYSSPDHLLANLNNIPFGNDAVLIKGASYEHLDRIADALSRRQHRTILRINLTALRHNFLRYRERAGTGMIVMVKAGAYGGGALPVARALAAAGADYLAVAYPDEGSALRRGGVRLPIMVLNADSHAFGRMRDDALEPVVHDLPGLRAAATTGLRVHLELDTGMGRLGFAPEQIPDLLAELGKPDYAATIASVFTHLAASEDQRHDDFTWEQLSTFTAACDRIDAVLPQPAARHALNTNGISRFPDYRMDYVRLGIGLYGVGDEHLAGLQPALRLTCRVTAVYERPAGTTVGYGRRGRLERDGRVAVLAIGYADGLPRLAGEGRFSVLIKGQAAPILGSVCMDMTMVDVTDLPEVQAGDEAVIFGVEHPLELLAAAAQTIPYEILTGVGERVHRVYVEE